MKKIIASLILSLYSFLSFAQIINPNPPGSVNWTAPGTIGSATPNTGVFTTVGTTQSIAGSGNAGTFFYGTLPYSDTGILLSGTGNVNSYVQQILINTNSGTAASADYIVGNNNNTATTYYGDFGMNSSGFTGTGALNAPNNVYLTSTSADLAIGTTTANGIHFCVNTCASDNLAISSTGVLSGTSLSNYFASPPAIGGTAPAYGTFTGILTTTSGVSANNGSAASPSHIFNSAATTGLYWANPGIGFSVAGVSAGAITSTGYTGTSATATNLAGGAAGSVPYQTASGTTALLPAGSVGQYMQLCTGPVICWQNTSGIYNPANVAITGGSINGTTIGATTPSTGVFTTLNANSGAVLGQASTTSTPLVINQTSGSYLAISGINGSGSTWAGFTLGSGSGGGFTTLGVATGTTQSGTLSALQTSSTPVFTVNNSNGVVQINQGMLGVSNGSNANSGIVGEYVSNTALGVSIPGTATATNIVSISLTAGDWDVEGYGELDNNSVAINNVLFGISTTSASFGSIGTYVKYYPASATLITVGFATPTVRVNITTTTTVYLVGQVLYGSAGPTASGSIRARRVR